jgi:DtxR family transcriptional regulator, Mn-dependent transcriptional regulator
MMSPASKSALPIEPNYTGPVEDYLKAIYDLERATGTAATNEIARRLDIAPPSVSGMVQRLAERGLLTYQRYRGVRLTEAGERAALRIVRRHRVIETFLSRVLGYPWDEVHAEAERLEHAASDELIDRMAAALDQPTVDPHGAPIPTRDGTIADDDYASLADADIGTPLGVVRVSDDDPARLRYLAELGLKPGVAVTVLRREPFEGPLTIRVGKRSPTRRSIGPLLARDVLVEPLPRPGSRKPR